MSPLVFTIALLYSLYVVVKEFISWLRGDWGYRVEYVASEDSTSVLTLLWRIATSTTRFGYSVVLVPAILYGMVSNDGIGIVAGILFALSVLLAVFYCYVLVRGTTLLVLCMVFHDGDAGNKPMVPAGSLAQFVYVVAMAICSAGFVYFVYQTAR